MALKLHFIWLLLAICHFCFLVESQADEGEKRKPDPQKYKGYKLYELHRDELEKLKSMPEEIYVALDFLGPTSIIAGPLVIEQFENYLLANNIKYLITVDDFPKTLAEEAELEMPTRRKQEAGPPPFDRYYRYDEINTILDNLAKKHSDKLKLEVMGKSSEGRDLKVAVIKSPSGEHKSSIFIHAGMHGREYITIPAALYMITQLVENASCADMIQKIEWHIAPLVNPDGYEYCHIEDRLWRKTRSTTNPANLCVGVDMNRNFDYFWNAGTERCSNTYGGTVANSEPETKAIIAYGRKLGHNLKLHLDLHSYHGGLLYPWSYTLNPPSNEAEFVSLAENVTGAIGFEWWENHGYDVSQASHLLWQVQGGVAMDYFHGVLRVPYTYIVEIIKVGSTKFSVPVESIINLVTHLWRGMRTFVNFIERKFP